jgi:catechol 2,3-dioxygenase-like lactoylglutathione lyase family enzyme
MKHSGGRPQSIHHITAIAGDPQRNLDFYSGMLGLRLVKVTVNFDDPGTYHLYYGDEHGHPGSIITFFPWPEGRPGRQGTGQVGTIALAIVPSSLGHWVERLLSLGIEYEGPNRRFDEQVLSFRDPDGLLLELVATPRVTNTSPWAEGPVPAPQAIRGIQGAVIWEDGDTGTADFLTRTLEFEPVGEEDNVLRFQSADLGVGTIIDLRRTPGFWRGAGGVGTVHHIAFRAENDQRQLEKRAEIEGQGMDITPVIDRQYFHSVYFREPGGVLFEIATDPPGFTIDEPLAELGTSLKLPAMYQASREELERVLPPLRLPHLAAGDSR